MGEKKEGREQKAMWWINPPYNVNHEIRIVKTLNLIV